MRNFGVKEWVDLFQQAGVDEKQMHNWHRFFEHQHPEAHESFLKWLGLDESRIEEIRERYAN